jgi:extradiol dioxygenase family protein
MSQVIKRPLLTLNPGQRLLRNDHFQMAYATTDIERARGVFRERYGIREFRAIEGDLAQGGHIHAEFAWAGGLMYELIQASGPGSEIFMSRLPTDGFAIRHHHLGYLVREQSDWDALETEIARRGLTIAWRSDTPGFIKAAIIDAPELGHYLEYIFPEAGGRAFLEGVPCS